MAAVAGRGIIRKHKTASDGLILGSGIKNGKLSDEGRNHR